MSADSPARLTTPVTFKVPAGVRALSAPGWLTLEYLRGRRTLYFGPLKVALLATAVLTSTWVMTRGVDSHYYGLPPYAGGTYIQAVARAALVGSVAMAGCSWVLAGGHRRVLDEIVFALHLVAALALLVSAVVLLATVYKLVWGTAAARPAGGVLLTGRGA